MGILIFFDLGGIDKAAKEIVNGLSEKIEEMKKILCQGSQQKTVSRVGGWSTVQTASERSGKVNDLSTSQHKQTVWLG